MPSKIFILLYGTVLAATLLAFVVQVVRWSKGRESSPTTGQDLSYRTWLPPGLRVSTGLLLTLLVVPFFHDNAHRLGRVFSESPGMLTVLLFPLVGLGLALSGMRGLLRKRAPRSLRLDQPEPRVGEVLSGSYVLPKRLADRRPVKVHLVLQRTWIKHWLGGQQDLWEKPVWHTTREQRPVVSGQWTEIPFLFEIPEDLPGSSWGLSRYEWVLVIEGKAVGTHRMAVRIGGPAKAKVPSAQARASSIQQAQEIAVPLPDGRPLKNPLWGLGATLFLIVFPVLMWMTMREQGFGALLHALPGILLKGAVLFSLLGASLLGLLIRVAQIDQVAPVLRRVFRICVGGVAVSLTVGLVWLAVRLTGGGSLIAPTSDAGTVLTHSFVDGLTGMFIGLGLYAFTVEVVGLARGDAPRAKPAVQSDPRLAHH